MSTNQAPCPLSYAFDALMLPPGVSIEKTKRSKMTYTCKLCGACFARNSNVKRHVKEVHVNLRIYECEHCFSDFATKRNLLRHKSAVHEKKKPWSCDECDYQGQEQWILNSHKRRKH